MHVQIGVALLSIDPGWARAYGGIGGVGGGGGSNGGGGPNLLDLIIHDTVKAAAGSLACSQ